MLISRMPSGYQRRSEGELMCRAIATVKMEVGTRSGKSVASRQ